MSELKGSSIHCFSSQNVGLVYFLKFLCVSKRDCFLKRTDHFSKMNE